MPALNPAQLTFQYSCEFRDVPGPDPEPASYPMDWTVSVRGSVLDDEDAGDGDDDMHVDEASFGMVPDAGTIHFPDTMDAVDQERLAATTCRSKLPKSWRKTQTPTSEPELP